MSTINDFGIPGVAPGVLHPKHKNLWRVTFANMGNNADSTPVSMQAITIERPKLEHKEIELHRYNTVSYVAAKHTWSPIQLVVEDDITGTASRVVQEQLQKQQWLVGAEGPWLAKAPEGSIYKFVAYLDQLDGGTNVVEQWMLEGTWIQKADYDALDYSTGEAVKITMTLRFDNARQLLGGYAGPGSALGGVGQRF